MGDNLIPVELGLSAFVAKLIEETFDAVVCSNYEQQKKHDNILSSLNKSYEEFAIEYVTESDSAEFLNKAFNGSLKKGAPYAGELKMKLEAMGIALSAEKHEISENILTDAGVWKVHHTIRDSMARERYAMLSKMATQGLPRVVVDAGQISAKVSFFTNRIETSPAAKPAALEQQRTAQSTLSAESNIPQKSRELQEFNTGRSLAVFLKKGEFLKSQPTSVLPNINISVRQATETSSTSSVGMVGEVIIKFKTV